MVLSGSHWLLDDLLHELVFVERLNLFQAFRLLNSILTFYGHILVRVTRLNLFGQTDHFMLLKLLGLFVVVQ